MSPDPRLLTADNLAPAGDARQPGYLAAVSGPKIDTAPAVNELGPGIIGRWHLCRLTSLLHAQRLRRSANR